jgi:hypothetical protein
VNVRVKTFVDKLFLRRLPRSASENSDTPCSEGRWSPDVPADMDREQALRLPVVTDLPTSSRSL